MRAVRVVVTLVVVTSVAIGVLALIARLSGGGESAVAEPRPAPSGVPVLVRPSAPVPGPARVSTKQARSALLTAEDVPAGWHAITGGAPSTQSTTSPARCGLKTSRVTLARASFSVPGTEASPGGTFDETVYRPTGTTPAQHLTTLEKTLAGCRTYTVTNPVAGSATVQLGALRLAALGDGTLAAAARWSMSVATVTENSVYVAVGPVVVELESLTVTDQLPAADLARLAGIAVQRIQHLS